MGPPGPPRGDLGAGPSSAGGVGGPGQQRPTISKGSFT